MTDANNLFLSEVATHYQSGEMDDNLDLVISAAALSGVVLLPGDNRPYVDATGGKYEIDDLLLPFDLKTWHTITLAYKSGMNIYPTWFAYNQDGYFDFNQDDLCREFIKSKRLTKHKGEYLMDGSPVRRNEVKSALRRTLAIVRKDAGKMIYGAFAALDTLCEDDDPAENRGRLTL